MNDPLVSLVIPVRNEEQHIDECINSILAQSYRNMEVLFVDGMSEDRTVEIIESYVSKGHNFSVLKNEKRIIPTAVNIGIRNSKGEYIVRMDAHSVYPANYVERCVELIDETGADNVGGYVTALGGSYMANAISYMISSKFGNGGADFRTGAKSGETETVPFGAFPKKTFEKYGLFDERLVRNEDNEINYRIRKGGGKVYIDADLAIGYYCRDTIAKLMKMGMDNGMWNMVSLKLCPESMGLRHFVPFMFLLSLMVGIPLAIFIPASVIGTIIRLLFLLELICYFALLAFVAGGIAKEKGMKYFFTELLLFPLFHISYGFGTLCGIFKALRAK